MSTIKGRNGMALQEQEILRRGGKNTQKRYTKKIFTTQITVIHTVKDIGIVNKAEDGIRD